MNILYYNQITPHRTKPLDHKSAYTTGQSGTDLTLIEYAMHLSEKNNVYLCIKDEDAKVDKITYISPTTMLNEKFDAKNLDYVCPMYHIYDPVFNILLDKLNPKRTKIAIHLEGFVENFWFERLTKRGFEMVLIHPSTYVKAHHDKFLKDVPNIVVGNPLSKTVFFDEKVDMKKKKGMIFHAAFERGGEIAIRVYRKLKKMGLCDSLKICSYFTVDTKKMESYKSEGITMLGSLGKKELCNLMRESRYFVYPLVLPNSNVHHDTFGNVILESLACGVVVLTWGVACIPGLYGDNIIAIDPPNCQGYNSTEPFSSNSRMQEKSIEDVFVDRIITLEVLPNKRDELVNKGIEFSKKFTTDLLGVELEKFLLQNVKK